jgi:DNA-binding CsgD family transcriptional regulator
MGDSLGIAFQLICLAELAWRRGDNGEAEAFYKEALPLFLDVGFRKGFGVVTCLEGLAVVAASQGQYERAVRLAGAVYKARERSELPRIFRAGTHPWEPTGPAEYEQYLDKARSALGESRWPAILAEGEDMGPEDAIAYALDTPRESQTTTSMGARQEHEISVARRPYPDDLTEREVEVLRLIAAGKSNQEIAQELVLSLRTVERHISNVYEKIGVHGKAARVSASAFATKHGLTAG